MRFNEQPIGVIEMVTLICFPCAQNAPISGMLAVWTNGDPLRFVNTVRAKVMAMDSHQPISGVETMEDVMEASEGHYQREFGSYGDCPGIRCADLGAGIFGGWGALPLQAQLPDCR